MLYTQFCATDAGSAALCRVLLGVRIKFQQVRQEDQVDVSSFSSEEESRLSHWHSRAVIARFVVRVPECICVVSGRANGLFKGARRCFSIRMDPYS